MTKNEIVKEIQKFYQNRQAQIKRLEEENFALNMQNEKFAQFEKEIRALTIDLAKCDNREKEKLLQEKINEQGKIRIPLSIQYECKKCCDSGEIDGKRCTCFNKKVSEMLIQESGVQTENLKKFSDSDFSKFENSDEIKKIYSAFETIVNKLSSVKFKNFLIEGDSGVGKTFLLSAIAGECIERGYSTFFVTAFNLNNLMLRYHTNFEADKEKFLAPVFDCDVLIIDDLGTEQIFKNVTKEYLLEILKERILAGKHTFISTNLSLSQIIDRYGERIFSRMVDKSNSLTIKMENKNLRLKK